LNKNEILYRFGIRNVVERLIIERKPMNLAKIWSDHFCTRTSLPWKKITLRQNKG